MGRGAAVAFATLTTLLASACGGASSGSDVAGALQNVRALAAASAAGHPASTVTAAGSCLAGGRQRDNPTALSAAIARFGIEAFDTFGSYPAWTDPVDCGDPHTIEV